MRKHTSRGTLVVLTAAVFASVFAKAGGPSEDDDSSMSSYSIGHQIGMDLVRQQRTVDVEALHRGLRDGMVGEAPEIPVEEIDKLLLSLKREIVTAERTDRIRGAPTLRQAGRDFMTENAQREDVTTLANGLQYRTIRAGTGKQPRPTDQVQIRYRSWRLDGTVFHDSTRPETQPETKRVGSLISGLREALPLMAEGARWEIFIPPDLAFGRRGPLADHTVVYDMELLAVVAGETTGSEATQ